MSRVLINTGWRFFKNCNSIEEMDAIKSIKVNLPHTWNNLDGQDGGNDYFRGKCFYRKKIALTKKENKEIGISRKLEFNYILQM